MDFALRTSTIVDATMWSSVARKSWVRCVVQFTVAAGAALVCRSAHLQRPLYSNRVRTLPQTRWTTHRHQLLNVFHPSFDRARDRIVPIHPKPVCGGPSWPAWVAAWIHSRMALTVADHPSNVAPWPSADWPITGQSAVG